IPDEVRDRVRKLKLLRERVGRIELRVADERVLIGGEYGQAVDPRVLRDAGHLKVLRRDEGASDRDSDARVQPVQSGPELVERFFREDLRIADGRAPCLAARVARAVVAAA